jgi:hypothetical protein
LILTLRIIPSNLHSCHSIIEAFRKKIPVELTVPFADLVFPEERVSSVVGRDVKFLLAVEERGAIGSCIMASSTEPLRTEILFIHSLKDNAAVFQPLIDEVISFLKSRRAPDLDVKCVEGIHSSSLKRVLQEREFAETVKDRMLLETSNQRNPAKARDETLRVTTTASLLTWRALSLSAMTSRSFEECKKQVQSETPYGTIQEDDLVRLLAYDGKSVIGTIGYSVCRNIAYLERLNVIPIAKDKVAVARALLSGAIRNAKRKKCDYIVIDVDRKLPRELIGYFGFKSLGKVSYFQKVITKPPPL